MSDHDPDIEDLIEKAVQDAVDGKLTVMEATSFLLDEMGRGGRIFVVDENLRGLERELSAMNYTTYTVKRSVEDWKIKEEIKGCVFITNNGKDFVDDVAEEKGDYGL